IPEADSSAPSEPEEEKSQLDDRRTGSARAQLQRAPNGKRPRIRHVVLDSDWRPPQEIVDDLYATGAKSVASPSVAESQKLQPAHRRADGEVTAGGQGRPKAPSQQLVVQHADADQRAVGARATAVVGQTGKHRLPRSVHESESVPNHVASATSTVRALLPS